MTRIAVSWVGLSDTRAPISERADDVGPVCRWLRSPVIGEVDRVVLLSDMADEYIQCKGGVPFERYHAWLLGQLAGNREPASVVVVAAPRIAGDYQGALDYTREQLDRLSQTHGKSARFDLLLSPGTGAMQIAMVLASRDLADVHLWSSWPRDDGADVEEVGPLR